jgi:hypothetical protein
VSAVVLINDIHIVGLTWIRNISSQLKGHTITRRWRKMGGVICLHAGHCLTEARWWCATTGLFTGVPPTRGWQAVPSCTLCLPSHGERPRLLPPTLRTQTIQTSMTPSPTNLSLPATNRPWPHSSTNRPWPHFFTNRPWPHSSTNRPWSLSSTWISRRRRSPCLHLRGLGLCCIPSIDTPPRPTQVQGPRQLPGGQPSVPAVRSDRCSKYGACAGIGEGT